MATFHPLDDHVLIRRLQPGQSGKLIIPDRAKELPLEGEVLAVGPGRLDADHRRVPMSLSVGMRVLFRKYAGTELKFDGQVCIVCRETEVIGEVRS